MGLSVDIPVRKPRRHKLHTKHAKEQSKKKEIYDKQAAINAVELKRVNAIREKGRKLNISCTKILNLYNKKYKNLKFYVTGDLPNEIKNIWSL